MPIVCTGTARIQHRDTEEVYQIEADELDWDSEGTGEERGMGMEIRHYADVSHPDLGDLTWSIWEYPEGVENLREVDVNGHTLLQDLDCKLEHDQYDE